MGMPWGWVAGSRLEKLEAPPIKEVICGFLFEPLLLDPVVVGRYAAQRQDDFPGHQIHPAIIESLPVPGFMLKLGPVPPLRVWLISKDDSWLIQLQRDRFYLNWRFRGAKYPSFSKGLREKALGELEQFKAFAREALDADPVLHRIELAKVDQMLNGHDWNGTADLVSMIPALEPFLGLAAGPAPTFSVHFDDPLDEGALAFKIDSTLSWRRGEPEPIRGVKIETRVNLPVTKAPLADRLNEANNIVNAAFARLVPETERRKRFGGPRG